MRLEEEPKSPLAKAARGAPGTVGRERKHDPDGFNLPRF
jgi:hypothetical protein